MATDARPAVRPEDDDFHLAEMGERWWMTETAWFAFCKPEIGLGGWLYNMVRPNIGAVSGGCWVWEPDAHQPWEVSYYSNLTAMPFDRSATLHDAQLRNGVHIQMLEPLHRYRVRYRDGDLIDLDLTYSSVMPPRPMAKNDGSFQKLSHFDQFCHVVGTLLLHGQSIEINCYAIRDRSWGPRPEHRPGRSAYVTGITDPSRCFLAVTKWNDPSYPITNGFFTLEGTTTNLVSGVRRVSRDADGLVDTIIIEAKDDLGRPLHAEGRRLSGIIINRHSFIDSNGLIEWRINGVVGHGEDQDMWPVHEWADMRRNMRAGAEG